MISFVQATTLSGHSVCIAGQIRASREFTSFSFPQIFTAHALYFSAISFGICLLDLRFKQPISAERDSFYSLRMKEINGLAGPVSLDWKFIITDKASASARFESIRGLTTRTAAHAGGHTQNVYGSWDNSVCITFAECEKIELMNTFTQNTNLNLHQTSPNTQTP